MGYVARYISKTTIKQAMFEIQETQILDDEYRHAGSYTLWKSNIDLTDIDYIWFRGAIRSETGNFQKDLEFYIGGVLKATHTRTADTYVTPTPTTEVDTTAISGAQDLLIEVVDTTTNDVCISSVSLIGRCA